MKTKIHTYLVAALTFFMLVSCKKTLQDLILDNNSNTNKYVEYFIAKDAHSSDKNGYKVISTTEMKFAVKFDNSAMYQTIDPWNQLDINKLYGFADNNMQHHEYSARIGWRWNNNQLELFGYVYNNGAVSEKYITAVPLNQEITCSIKTETTNYRLTANGVSITMPRTASTEKAEGYQLYPYFGGDEKAPHDIKIQIKNLP